ncbi:strawberry notch C-terminal domain-containing protein [Azospirillum brasilense]|uniref:strawberry notch C-terminal domain-containing protein n=1 Tax=Azospirillum brasilense TaxID=192 RepID=UPI000E0BA804|nr:strawberry notch C-terminal domain-containing protein [Azospirillum brasilense]
MSVSAQVRAPQLADLSAHIGAGTKISLQFLIGIANQHFGGTMAAGTYTTADAYDLAEQALNKLILELRVMLAPTVGLVSAQVRVGDLEAMGALLPTRTRRDDEVEAFDQFSTPPALGFAAAWLADLKPGDVVLEPSAGSGLNIGEFQRQLGLKLLNEEGDLLIAKLPTVKQFLNRLLSMCVDPMNRLFDEFASRLDQAVEAAAEAGLLNVGVETVIADSIEVMSPPRVVYTCPRTGAETTYTELKVWRRNNPITYDEVMEKHPDIIRFVKNRRTGRVYALRPAHNRTDLKDGSVVPQYRLVGPLHTHYVDAKHIDDRHATYEFMDRRKAPSAWAAEVGQSEPFQVEAMHVISGILLPIWDKLADTGEPKVYRLQTDDGARLLGRVVPAVQIRQVLAKLGASYGKPWSPKEAIKTVLAGHDLLLANGWKLARAKVSGEARIELKGPLWGDYYQDLKKVGVIQEMISGTTRFFVPHGGPGVMAKVIQFRPVVDGGIAGR